MLIYKQISKVVDIAQFVGKYAEKEFVFFSFSSFRKYYTDVTKGFNI